MGWRVNLRVTDILIPFWKITFSYKSNENKVAEYSREFSTIEKFLILSDLEATVQPAEAKSRIFVINIVQPLGLLDDLPTKLLGYPIKG